MSLSFKPFSPGQYDEFKEFNLSEYTKEVMTAMQCDLYEAQARAIKDFDNVLANGMNTPSNYFYSIMDEENSNIGYLWCMIHRESQLYICDFRIYDAYRRRGYASQALELLEGEAKQLGCSSILLNVFDHNKAGIALYEKCGFELHSIEERGCRYLIKNLK